MLKGCRFPFASCRVVQCDAVLCQDGAVLCGAVLCCAVLRCAALCCAVLCTWELSHALADMYAGENVTLYAVLHDSYEQSVSYVPLECAKCGGT